MRWALGLVAVIVGCGSDPGVVGRPCSAIAPCPQDYVCTAAETCQLPCQNDDFCAAGQMCMSGLCLEIQKSATCVNQDDCGAGELCRAGLCEPADAGECQTASECVSPGRCQVATGATCDAGRCLYASLVCDSPPEPECTGADDLYRTYAAGACEVSTGQCVYPARDVVCPDCTNVCLEPCAGLSCPDLEGGCQTGGRCETQTPPAPAACVYETAASGVACTRADGGAGTCQQGACVACVDASGCDDNNPCTLDACDGSGACTHTPQTGACDDGNLCTLGDSCVNGLCRGATAVACDSPPGECYAPAGTCEPSSGQCSYAPRAAGSACTPDAVVCTQDICDGNGACTHPPAPASTLCDDADLCTYSDHCNGNGSCRGTSVTCADGAGVCGAARSCNGTAQCTEVFPSLSTSCNDNNLCTHTDRCNGAGGCQGVSYSCNDNDICTSDACDGVGGCTNALLAPTGLAPTGGATVSRQDVILVWSPCTGATDYELEIQYQRSDGSWWPYVIYTETGSNKTFYPCSSQAPAAPCNSNFRFRVRARTGGVFSPYPPWATFLWANCRAC